MIQQKLEFMHEGKLYPYDASIDYPLEDAKEFYKGRFVYIGNDHISYNNGVPTQWLRKLHFFKRIKSVCQ